MMSTANPLKKRLCLVYNSWLCHCDRPKYHTETLHEKQRIPFSECIQSGASSQAKHGGAYFSAIRGSIEDPIAVPGRHEVPRV